MHKEDSSKFCYDFINGLLKMGAARFGFYESGAYDSDFHAGNLGLDPLNGNLVSVDYAEMKGFDYPKEWKKIFWELNPLLSSINTISSSYYRFGFIQSGGPVATELFNILRREKSFNSFKTSNCFSYVLDVNKITKISNEEIEKRQIHWMDLVKKMPLGDLDGSRNNLNILRVWNEIRKTFNLSNEEEELALEYHSKKQLYIFFNKDVHLFIEGMFNLASVYFRKAEYLKSSGIYLYIYKLLTKSEIDISSSLVQQINERLNASILKLDKVCLTNHQHLVNDFDDTPLFLYLWHLDDLSEGTLLRKPKVEEKILID